MSHSSRPRGGASRRARRHPSSARFHEILAEHGELHDRKQADYGRDQDPFANVRASEAFGIPGWIGAVVRASDKMRRLEKAARDYLEHGETMLANEGVVDSLDDLAVYATIARVLFEELTDPALLEELEEQRRTVRRVKGG